MNMPNINITPPALERAANTAWSTFSNLMNVKLPLTAINSPVVFGLSTLLSVLFAYLISISIYRIWFHPLSKHPGPLLCKLTSTIWAYHFTKGTILQWEAKQHKKYGQTVRLGPNRLSFIDPRAWKDIYGHKFGQSKPNVKNLDRAAKNLPSGRLPMALEPTTAGHSAQRKLFNPAFGERAWKDQERLVHKYIEQLMSRVSGEIAASPSGDAVVDIATLWNFMTFDVMGDLTFGEGLGQLETGIESSWVPAVFVMYKLLNKRSVIKAYPLGGFLFDLFAPRGYLQDSGKHMQHCRDLVAKRLEKGNDGRPDIFGHVLKQTGESMSRTLMDANANMLMVAGTETTATTLTTTTHLLLRNPDKMQKLIREIRAVPDRAKLNSQTVQRMKYLNAVLEEALRFYPSGQVGLGTQREIAPGGNQICDDFLAEGTEVAVAAWTMSNSSLHWKDPAAFVPERWLLEETDFSAYHEYDNRVAWLAFGTGPRTCIGKNIAMHEIRGVLARFLYDFDLALTPETVDWLHVKTHSIWAKPKLMARVTPAR
ncbi:Cytochrome P450 monooxygenase FUM2 [Colletotrichum shisoi]|uniref:Cytochrome P450 monooxygenase FUM2 n=1 Tax=Colletotrichum shisoi TaxID=2078593 RepID=A0A5Q4BPW2_9PEZI|nr:Cytochrome P450 monooxygenase FUM2 [Colletotrichum shisoi]